MIARASEDQGFKASLDADLLSSTSHGNSGKRTRGTERDNVGEGEDGEEAGAEREGGEFFGDIDEEDGDHRQSIADRMALLSSVGDGGIQRGRIQQ